VFDPDGRLTAITDVFSTGGFDCRRVTEWSTLESAVAEADCLVLPDHPAADDYEEIDVLDLFDRVRTEFLIDLPVVAYATREGHRPIRRAFDHGLDDVVRVPPSRPELLCRRLSAVVSPDSALSDPRDQLHSLLRSYPDTLFIKDRLGRFESITNRTAEKYGFGREELAGMSDYELFDPDHADELWAEEQQIMAEEAPMRDKVEHYTDEAGNDQWVRTTKVPRYDEEGNVVGIVGGTEYVTTAKRQEELIAELHEANQRLARAQTKQEIAEESITIATELEPFERSEIALAEFDSGSLRPVAATDDDIQLWDESPDLFERVFETGEIEYVRIDGESIPDRGVAVVNRQASVQGDREATGAVVPLGDHGVFAFRLVEREPFVDFVDRLSRVFAANIEAAFDRAEREQELDEKRRRIEEFATLGSHELRNKLQVVMASLARVGADYDDDRLESTHRMLDRMDRILQQLLRLARTGEAVSHARRHIDIETAATAAWDAIEPDTATLRPESTTTIEANENALVGLFEFLLENAVQHGPPDVTVRVGTLREDSGFYVADDGPGIDRENRSTLFDVEYTEKPDERGYGLFITATIAEAHGWEIDVVESNDGGARFEITGVETP